MQKHEGRFCVLFGEHRGQFSEHREPSSVSHMVTDLPPGLQPYGPEPFLEP